MKELNENIENLWDFIIDEIPEEILANDENNDIEHILIACLQLITAECKSQCYKYFSEFLEYKQKKGIKK